MAFHDIGRLPLLLPSATQSVRRHLDALALAEGVTLNVRLEVDSVYLLRHLVTAGHGFAITSQGMFREEIAAGTVRSYPIVDPSIRRTVSIVGSAHRRSVAGRHLHALLCEVAHALVASGAWPGTQWIADGAPRKARKP